MIHAIVCGYKFDDTIEKCRKSIQMQTYQNYVAVESDGGAKPDGRRRYLLENTVDTINSCGCDPDDIVACIDADDWLCDEMAFQVIADAYKANPDLLLTYGSYVNLSSNKTGKFCQQYQYGEEFRTSAWRGSHLKTFKYKLFQKIPKSELVDQNGEHFKCCADRAMMVPMMEMAGHDRIQHIPMILYCYNDLNPNSVWNTMKDLSKSTREHISRRQPLNRLVEI